MSEFIQAVLASLTDEWRSTREIADGLPRTGRANPLVPHVFKVLSGAERAGVAEK